MRTAKPRTSDRRDGDGDWSELVARLRRGPAGAPEDGGEATYHAARKALGSRCKRLARSLKSFERTIGTGAFEDTVHDTIWGERGVLEQIESSSESDDGSGRRVIHNPRVFAQLLLSSRLKDERGRQRRRGAVRENPFTMQEEWIDPTILVAAVARSFREAAGFAGTLLRLAAELPVDHPTRRVATSVSQRHIENWSVLAGYLERDVRARESRPRWDVAPDGEQVAATDNHGRAWQARYYSHEEEWSFTDPAEIPPAGAPNRHKFDKHAERFRDRYGEATGSGLASVRAGEGLGARLSDNAGRRVLPSEWAFPWHDTLGKAPP